MEEKNRTWIIVGVSAVILVGIGSMIVLTEGLNLWSVAMLIIVVALALVAILLAFRTRKEIRSGLPLEDERTISLNMKAAYKAFFASLYLFLFLGFGLTLLDEDELVITSSELVFIMVAIMGSIHIILLTYYHRRFRVTG